MNDMRRMHGGAYVQFVLYCQWQQQQQQANEYGDDPSFLLSIAIYSYYQLLLLLLFAREDKRFGSVGWG